jgi:transcriptional regulator with XRE-family HTH domain
MVAIADIIKRTRLSAQVSQEQVADFLAISRETYSRKELGKVEFSFGEVERTAQFLGTTIQDLTNELVPGASEANVFTDSLISLVDQRVEATLRVRLHEMVNQAIDHHTDRRFAVVAVHEPEAQIPHAAEPPAPSRNTGK